MAGSLVGLSIRSAAACQPSAIRARPNTVKSNIRKNGGTRTSSIPIKRLIVTPGYPGGPQQDQGSPALVCHNSIVLRGRMRPIAAVRQYAAVVLSRHCVGETQL